MKKTTFKNPEGNNLDKDNLLALGELVEQDHPAIKCMLEFCKIKHADIYKFLEGNILNVGFPDRDVAVFIGEARAMKKDIPELFSLAKRLYNKEEGGEEE